MSQPRDDRQDDLFRPPLEEIINLRHPLVRLAGEIDWDFLAGRFSSVCRVGTEDSGSFLLRADEMIEGRFLLRCMSQFNVGRGAAYEALLAKAASPSKAAA